MTSKVKRKYKMLVDLEIEPLNWSDNFQFPNMVRIRTDFDGSCFFHGVTKAYFAPYITGKLGSALDKRKWIRKLRKDLSLALAQRVDPQDPTSPTFYQTLSRGELETISEELPKYSLKNLQKLLDSSRSVGNIFNEFVSDQIDKDIYILDMDNQDVYMVGDDSDILYKDRSSIVLLYLSQARHYELVGIKNVNTGDIQTLFSPDHDFIVKIRNRINERIRTRVVNQDIDEDLEEDI